MKKIVLPLVIALTVVACQKEFSPMQQTSAETICFATAKPDVDVYTLKHNLTGSFRLT